MKQNNIFKNLFIGFIVFVLFFSSLNFCNAEEKQKEWETALEAVVRQTEYKAVDTNTNLISVIAEIIKIFLSLLGIIFIILMIYAGYLWMTAGGNDEQVAKSKTIIRNCLIGLIIALSAYAITYYVIENLIQITKEERLEEKRNFWKMIGIGS